MMFRSRLPLVVLAAVIVAACSSDDGSKYAEEAKASLCQFGQKNSATQRVSYVKWTGGLYNDDIDVKEYQEKGVTSIVSALARPKNKRYQANQRQDCYDATKKIYYPCVVKVDVNLAPLSAIGRAPDAANAKFTATYSCERLAVQAAHDASKAGLIESSALECEVVEVRTCPIPKKVEEPKPQDKPKPQGG